MADTPGSTDGSSRIYFVHPDSTVRDEVVPLLVRNEYEAYALDNHDALASLVQSDQSIVYADIDNGMGENEWQELIVELTQQFSAPQLRVGVLSADNQTVQNWKSSNLDLQAGCVPIQSGVTGTLLIKLLQRFAAKGKRQHVRARCGQRFPISFNVKINDSVYTGTVQDISGAGMTCRFQEEPNLTPNSYLSHILVTARDLRCNVSGTVVGAPNQDPSLQLVMFDKSVSSTDESKLYEIIRGCLQACLQEEIAAKQQGE
jgi:hypothetical protein